LSGFQAAIPSPDAPFDDSRIDWRDLSASNLKVSALSCQLEASGANPDTSRELADTLPFALSFFKIENALFNENLEGAQ